LSNPNAVATSGTYYIKATSPSGCSTLKPVSVSINAKPTINMTVGSSALCSGDSTMITITMTGTAPFQITYSDGTNSYTIGPIASNTYQFNVKPTTTTTYTVSSINDANCSSAGSLSSTVITVAPPVLPVRYPTVTAQPNVSTQLTARNLGNGSAYSWRPPVGLNFYNIINPVFKYDSTTQYTIAITSPGGCTVVDTLLVRVPVAAPPCDGDVFVPKAWSPNGDGHNDKLKPLIQNIREIKFFRIFNRWGELVFETNVISGGWDGIYKGKLQASDTYTWTCEAVTNCGKVIRRSGNSLLLR
jgi:gliding motility-associated-like protein